MGYRFHHEAETVYNPVSVMKCFYEREFKNYWFETGTPTFLVDLLKRDPINLGDLTAPEEAFSAYEPSSLAVLPVLVQTGYLTIRDAAVTGRSRQYRLGFPNFEIEESFSYWLARAFSSLPDFEPFMDDGRRITLIGAAFNRKTRNLGRWLIEPV